LATGDLTQEINLRSKDEIGVLGSAFDEMVASLNKYILNTMVGGVITINNQGIITSFNPTAEVVLGYNAHEVTGQPYTVLFSGSPENKIFNEMIKKALKGQATYSREEIVLSTREGKNIPIELSLSRLIDKGDVQLGIVITFKNLAEIKNIQNKLRQADQLALLGSLTGGLAHELRNPLASLHGLAELLREEMGVDGNKKAYLDRMIQSVNKLNNLMEDLLNYAQPMAAKFEPKDINKLLEEALSFVQCELPKKVSHIVKRYKRDLPPVWVDPEKMNLAFMNIIRNGIQATPDGGTITISSSLKPTAVVIGISNTGSFIPPENMDKIFVPFFSTRQEGTGLGLPIAQRIIASHGGEILVESDPHSGTTFQIRLPSASPEFATVKNGS